MVRGQVIISGAKTMATSLEQLLAGSYGGTDSYLKKSPWAQAGAQIMQIETPVAQTNAQAFSIPFIQGLLGGGLMGYGKKQATQQAFEDYSKNPLLKGTYASGEMPEGWSADTGRTDLLQGLVRAEAEKKAEEQRLKQAAAMEKFLMGKSLRATPTGGVEVDPDMLAAKKQILEEEEKIKGKYKKGFTINNLPSLGTEVIDRVSDMKVTGDQAIQLADDIEKTKPSWLELQGGKYAAFLDESGFAQRAKIAATDYVRAMSGTAVPPEERKMADRMMTGDMTLRPDQIAVYMRRFGQAIKDRARAKVNTIREIQSGAYEGAPGGAMQTGSLGTPTGKFDRKTGKPVYIVNGVEGIHED